MLMFSAGNQWLLQSTCWMCLLSFDHELFCCCQGKFWKNFGHNEDGKQWLYPEEALFLMDEVSNASVLLEYYCLFCANRFAIHCNIFLFCANFSHCHKSGWIILQGDMIQEASTSNSGSH